jgi:hypothetical protein
MYLAIVKVYCCLQIYIVLIRHFTPREQMYLGYIGEIYLRYYTTNAKTTAKEISSLLATQQCCARTFKCLWGPGIDAKE